MYHETGWKEIDNKTAIGEIWVQGWLYNLDTVHEVALFVIAIIRSLYYEYSGENCEYHDNQNSPV